MTDVSLVGLFDVIISFFLFLSFTEGVSLKIAIAVGVSLFVLLILVTAIAIYFWRR